MKSRYIPVIPFLALGLAGYAQTGNCADNVSSLAGVYSSAHPITIDGAKVPTNGYIEIDQNGRITAFEQDDEGPASVGSGCYRLAAGTATNAGLQGRILTLGVSPRGDAVYQTLAGDGDTFGILVKPAASGDMQWFFHWGRANSTVTINGSKNVVNSLQQLSYSISGPALTSPTPAQLRGMLCHSDTSELPHVKVKPDPGIAAASNAVAANALHQRTLPASVGNSSSPLAAALPFEIGKPIDTTALGRFGIPSGSSRAKILMDWAQKLVSDPGIKAYFSTTNTDPTTASTLALSHASDMLDGMQRISREDREQLIGITTRALDRAPPDCGGVGSLQAIMSRYLSLETESDEEFQAQLHATFDLLKQSTQNTPPPQITAAQRLQGQLAVSTSIANALKQDPSEADDLGLLMSGKQADLSPAAWCRATRFYRDAFNKTPQPARDWVMLAALEDQKRLASILVPMLKNFSSMPRASQQPIAPTVFDYAEAVRHRVRPCIVWNGKPVHGETVLEVRCTSSGNLESVRIVHSSGDMNWDRAAVMAVRQADPMPLDENGEAPRSFKITLRPGI
ncbi:energy transducer TonB [Paraburkholderia sp. 22099]|jgi:TonB family protein|uniref:energy transducer TonB n=1 Tax=Paraburkholderia TaxID=1822464 RepID=UPI0028555160|nr:energy transducer TonB [Paraburkholderia terricola]MDR6491493.1 TonB family protein [Paraburkholderia terricola]